MSHYAQLCLRAAGPANRRRWTLLDPTIARLNGVSPAYSLPFNQRPKLATVEFS